MDKELVNRIERIFFETALDHLCLNCMAICDCGKFDELQCIGCEECDKELEQQESLCLQIAGDATSVIADSIQN